jgi:ribosomal protein S19
MHRSKWKFLYFSPKMVKTALIYAYIIAKKTSKPSKVLKKPYLKFLTKNFCIPKFLRNTHIWVHQGQTWTKRQVFPFMIGHKVGEFGLTRKLFFYPPKKKKKR